jgi:predicted nucleic acid-binding Zn ribbon protein
MIAILIAVNVVLLVASCVSAWSARLARMEAEMASRIACRALVRKVREDIDG